MSLILDALKRAERERRADTGPAPGDVAVPAAGTGAPPRRGRTLVLAAITLAVVGSLALGWKAWRARRAPQPAETVVTTPAPAQPPAQQAPPVIMARPAPQEAPAVVPGTEDVASLDDLTDEPVLEAPASAPAPLPAPAVPPQPAPSTGAPASGPAAPAPKPPASQPREPSSISTTPAPPPTAAAPTTVPPNEIPPALTQPAPLRKFREMPPDYRRDFPQLKVEIHVYEKQPQRRFVMINGHRYREGERLSEGPALLEIVPEGMVLDYRGEKVLYTLGR